MSSKDHVITLLNAVRPISTVGMAARLGTPREDRVSPRRRWRDAEGSMRYETRMSDVLNRHAKETDVLV